MNEFLQLFLTTETPFALLFIALFFYVIKTNKEREKQHYEDNQKRIKAIQEDMSVLIKVWKILLENELEEKKNVK